METLTKIITHLSAAILGVAITLAWHWRDIFKTRDIPSDSEELKWLIEFLNEGKE